MKAHGPLQSGIAHLDTAMPLFPSSPALDNPDPEALRHKVSARFQAAGDCCGRFFGDAVRERRP